MLFANWYMKHLHDNHALDYSNQLQDKICNIVRELKTVLILDMIKMDKLFLDLLFYTAFFHLYIRNLHIVSEKLFLHDHKQHPLENIVLLERNLEVQISLSIKNIKKAYNNKYYSYIVYKICNNFAKK